MNQVQLERPLPLLTILAFLVSFGLVTAGAITQNPHLQIGAILPGLLAVSYFLTRPRAQELVFTETNVEDQFGNHLFDYNDVLGLAINELTPSINAQKIPGGVLQICLPNRVLEFHNLKAKTASTIYQELLEQVPDSGSRSVCPTLEKRLANQLSAFEDDSVYSFISRKWRSNFKHFLDPTLLAFLLTGIAWLIIAIAGGREYEVWAFVSGFVISITIVIRVLISLSRVSTSSGFSKLKNSALVISPDGIAMHQGKLTGYLKWTEVQAIEGSKRRSLGRFQGPCPNRAIAIKIAGAEIPIFDIYDRPLAKIHQCLMTYWTPPQKNATAPKEKDPFQD